MFFKGYVATKDKKCLMKFKDVDSSKLLTLEEAKKLEEYAGILDNETVLIDVDDMIQSNKLLDIVEDKNIRCRVYKSTRGMHFLFKNGSVPLIKKCATHMNLACGITADIKVGVKNSYEVLKFKGKEREIIYDILEDEEYDLVPYRLYPVKSATNFFELGEGDGRNQSLFNYILRLQKASLNKEEIRDCLNIINKYILASPLSDEELSVISRDGAFAKTTFFNDSGRFLFDEFARYLINNSAIKMINENLYIYHEGVYVDGYKYIEQEMIKNIPNLTNANRSEVLKYLNLIAPNADPCSAYYIAFKNGIYNIVENRLMPFNESIIITNKINYNYNEDAYNELADKTLNKLSCGNKKIRMLLEECIGYCFFRRNELRKSFMLIGDKKNGKSTFLGMIEHLLGVENISNLDLKEIGDRFRTAEIFGKLANIGDDIDDEYITNTAVFKKVVSGSSITVERKGEQPFRLEPYCKFLFSANDIPRMKDKTGAVVDRLVIIPFNATFSVEDKDFDPYIKYKLQSEDVMEYLIKIGINALKRVLENNSFTSCNEINDELEKFNERNNPILLFLKEITDEDVVNKIANDVYVRYSVWCIDNGFQAISSVEFGKIIKKEFDVDAKPRKIEGKSVRIYVKN